MNLTLRDVIEVDLPVFFEHQRDEEAMRMAAFPARDRDAFTKHWATILCDPTVRARAILVDGHVVGNVVAFERSGQRWVGYWIGRDYWGRGVATKALAAFLAGIPERPLHAHVAKQNPASIRVLEKCGFEVEGTASDDVEEFIMRLDGPARS